MKNEQNTEEWLVVRVSKMKNPKYSIIFGPYKNKNYAEELLAELPSESNDQSWVIMDTQKAKEKELV